MSEPERPSVVVSPFALRAMKPVTTGRTPAERIGLSLRLTRGSLLLRSHVAAPWRSSVTSISRASTARAGTPAFVERGREKRRRQALAERGDEVGDAGRALAQEGDALERGGELAERRRVEAHAELPGGGGVPRAQRVDGLAGEADAAALGVARGLEEDVRHASHGRGDGHDGPLPARGGEEAGGVADAGSVAQRRPAELVDRDRSRHGGAIVPPGPSR